MAKIESPGRAKTGRPLRGEALGTSNVRPAPFRVLGRILCIALTTGTITLATAAPAAAQAGQGPATSFRIVAMLGDSAPGGGNFLNDFEVGGLNNLGDASFVSDLTNTPVTEGVYVGTSSGIVAIARGGQPAPGGGTLNFELGLMGINASSQLTAPLSLTPDLSFPFGLNVGVYTARPGSKLSAVVVPGVTSAPSGGTFQGALNTDINDGGDIAFDGIIPTASGIGEASLGLGMGVFQAARTGGAISVVAQPGDPAPGGGTFDFAGTPTINGDGDIAFRGHVAGDSCVAFFPQTVVINCFDSVYLRRAATGVTERIAGIGDPAPGGGLFSFTQGAKINAQGQVAFLGSLTPAPTFSGPMGAFLASPEGGIVAVARPGDSMPGGGTLASVRRFGCFALNNAGDVLFEARLTDGATGVYVWSHGVVHLVARTGTVVPGFGTLASTATQCDASRALNDRRQVLFVGTSTDGRTALLLADAH